MPVIDMPLEKLYEYKGINPKPSDFDEYWERALSEMEAQDPKVQLIPAHFKCNYAEAFDLYFTGVGDSRIYAKYLRPKGKTNCPVLFVFHGYTGAFYEYCSYLSYVAAGFCVAMLDCRGQGGKSEDAVRSKGNTLHGHIRRGLEDENPDKLYYRNMFLDTAQLVKIVSSFPEVDKTRMGCKGGSQGGGLSYACASLVPDMKVVCAHYPFLSDYKRVWDMDLDVSAYCDLRQFFRHVDPEHKNEDKYFTKLGYIDIHHLSKRIRAKMYMFTGLMDTVCPPSTQFAAYNAIPGEKQVIIYPDFGHESLPESEDMIFEIMCEELL